MTTLRAIIVIGAVICILVALPAAAELLSNPGFESGMTSWGSRYGSSLVSVVDSTTSHSGVNSVKTPGDGTTHSGGIVQAVPTLPTVTTYTLSGWIKTRGLAQGWAGLLNVEFTAADGTWLGITGGGTTYSTTDWHYVIFTFTVPSGTANIYVECVLHDDQGLGLVNSGTAWFDDLSLLPPTTVTGKVSLPGYLGDITGVGAAIEVRGATGTQVFRTLLGMGGSFTLPAVNVGACDIAVKACGYIRALKSGLTVTQPTDVGTISLVCGDVDGDNYIGSVDHSIISSNQSSAPHP